MVKEKLTKLIDVKSIITILLTIGFVIMCIFSDEVSERAFLQYSNIYTVVIAFYFGTQQSKIKNESDNITVGEDETTETEDTQTEENSEG